MVSFSNAAITLATTSDIPALLVLLNSAYRGEASRQGWTTEADLIAGDVRTDYNDLLRVMQTPASVMLKYTDPQNEITGCVNLQQRDNKIYLGMFSVSPQLQGGGIGRQLLLAAEEYARNLNCNYIYMLVIAARAELIAWYKRNNYYDTGERIPFKEDDLSGKHLQPLEFMVLEKELISKTH
ncbi:GNAT family N-acetyltransferase [Parafilimonas terrae]|uniref:Acetyltransferase (GNAT) domain-containing protein n=1 Tax=Parafilimonas terrae TaxID=1465490 RepID=A0A1I5U7Q7_9BACT|nr:GNAT family N-acetyltransferase [Parafilimonas terrae]SFP90656.1 Acetyltransferase (GNAT) domain-containing protein [Parafilimonas terrae]